MGGYSKERAAERIAKLAGGGFDLITFCEKAAEIISPVIPHYMAPCWFTLDPASLLVTSHYDHGVIPELPPEWLAHEYYEDDVHKIADVVRSQRGVSTLHEATQGDPSRSPGWQQYIRPYGGEQELLVALRTRTGEPRAMLGLYREPGRPLFDTEDRSFSSRSPRTSPKEPSAGYS